MGQLVFEPSTDPTHLRTFDAYYIFVYDGGVLQIGTETEPYTSQIIFTLHGDRSTPKIPTYGNKVIAVRQATLDIHGAPIALVKSSLGQTALAGDSSILLVDAVNW